MNPGDQDYAMLAEASGHGGYYLTLTTSGRILA